MYVCMYVGIYLGGSKPPYVYLLLSPLVSRLQSLKTVKTQKTRRSGCTFVNSQVDMHICMYAWMDYRVQ